jgi:hypothetical protein
VEPTLEQEIRKGQIGDAKIQEIKDLITKGRGPEFTEDEQGIIWFKNRICVPEIDNLRETILKEAHDSDYSIHLGSTKMYQDLKHKYWWYGLKRDVAAHVGCVSKSQGRIPTTSRTITLVKGTRMEVGRNWYEFHCRVASHPKRV